MQLSMALNDFKQYVAKQINQFFPDNQTVKFAEKENVFDLALQRTEYCFKDVLLPTYKKNGKPFLNHLHSDQYTVFLWFLSNCVWKETANEPLANKLFYLNKALNGFSCLFDTHLPDTFLLLHNVGTVLGKAEYSDYFVVAQGCTVGAQNGVYPRIGRGVAMLPNSSVIGNSIIGGRSSIGVKTTVYQQTINPNTVVYTDQSGSVKFKENRDCWSQKLYSVLI